MNHPGFQVWCDAWGNLYCADGVVIQPTTGTRVHVGSGNAFGETLVDITGEILRAFPAAYGATALGGSGRNLVTTGLVKDLSGPDVPCGVFTAAEPSTWRLGIFSLAKTGTSTAIISDGTNIVASMTTGTAPAGNYAATAYGKTTYHGGADFTITATAETGTPLGCPAPVSVVTAGTGPAGAWVADSAATYHLAADAAWTLTINPDGTAEIKHSSTIMASRAAASAWNPAGVYAATSAGKSGYNSGADFNIVLTLSPLNPRAGYVYLQVVCSGGALSAVNEPYFGSLPSNSGETYYVPLAQSDGAGGLEQFHTGALVWPGVAERPKASVYSSANQTLAANVYTKLVLDQEEYDIGGCWDTSASQWTAPYACFVDVQIDIMNGGVNAGIIGPAIFKNGSQVRRVRTEVYAAVAGSSFGGCTTIQCAAGDVLDIRCYVQTATTAQASALVTYAQFSVRS